MKLICHRCFGIGSAFTTDSSAKLISMDNFKDYLTTIVAHTENKIGQQGEIVDVKKIIKEKKQDI